MMMLSCSQWESKSPEVVVWFAFFCFNNPSDRTLQKPSDNEPLLQRSVGQDLYPWEGLGTDRRMVWISSGYLRDNSGGITSLGYSTTELTSLGRDPKVRRPGRQSPSQPLGVADLRVLQPVWPPLPQRQRETSGQAEVIPRGGWRGNISEDTVSFPGLQTKTKAIHSHCQGTGKVSVRKEGAIRRADQAGPGAGSIVLRS